MNKFKAHIYKYVNFYTILGLSILFYFIFFHNNWAYMLMDVDESRYVSMSRDMWNTKDFLTLYLNKEFFFEKPPLFFWSECFSFCLFRRITEATARFPMALYGTLTCFFVYFIGEKIVSRTYGLISALILATSIEFVILSKFAILDIVLTAFVTFSVGCGILTLYVKENNKKFCWWLFYAFSGLAVLSKGIPGIVIPFGSMFFTYLYAKKLKELFKPLYIIPGIVIFSLLVLPWHIIMINLHGDLFIKEYIIKHHIARFMGSTEIGRQQPSYFYFLTLLWGFLPWIISGITVLLRKIYKKDLTLKNLNKVQTFIIYNSIIVLFILAFFSISSTKLITYILPIYPFLAFLTGYIWTNYVDGAEYKNIINITTYIIGGIFIIASVLSAFTQYYLPYQINQDISPIKPFAAILLFISGLLAIIFTKKEKYYGVFFTFVLFVTMLSAFGTEKIFEIDYKFGQDDLLKISRYADDNNKSIYCFGFDKKYSLTIYSDENVKYQIRYSLSDISDALKNENVVVVIENKNISHIKDLKYKIIMKGRKYTLINHK